MEPPDSAGPEPRLASGPVPPIIPDGLLSDDIHDDERSSSLSDIDERLDHLEDMSPKQEKPANEVDSEAETERIEDSPSRLRSHTSIVLSAGAYGTSPSKLAQSTTYEDLDEDDINEAENSPSKPPRDTRINGVSNASKEVEEGTVNSQSAPQEAIGKKRKRGASVDEEEDMDDEEPLRKRRGSPSGDRTVIETEQESADTNAPEMEPKKNEASSNDEVSPVNEDLTEDSRPSTFRGRKGKKGKRKAKKTKDTYDDMGENIPGEGNQVNGDEQLQEDEENGDGADGADDPEAALKLEESMKKTTAMDVLLSLERQFASLRDKIYDDRIASINEELAQLEKPNPTHPEFLRQLRIIENYRDEKMKIDEKLFAYKMRSLCIKSQAERSQVNSSYYQNVRDIRERYLQEISEHHYRVQHDRFQTSEISADYGIPFPSRRSQQAAQQAAYSMEVSILAGTAKYVGFPSAPEMKGLQRNEIEEDFAKLGISLRRTNPNPLPHAPLSQHHDYVPMSSVAATRQAAEEEFLEQTPWANPQHPIHEQYRQQMHQERVSDHQRFPNSFSTPAAQQRVVDLNAPNGSASTIPEHPSAPNSSAANTPYDYDRSRRNPGIPTPVADPPNSRYPESDDMHGPSAFRSLSSSPLDVRRPHPQKALPKHELGRRSPGPPVEPMGPPSSVRDIPYSPSSSTIRAGRFGIASRGDQPSSPTSAARQKPQSFGSMHQNAGIAAGSSERSRVTNP
ncbi:hypothetical protein D8B26_001116 [Coccidioides posadasii str. Silveira]|uniref:Uncharacterized protein n=1 Tax=Coccidioides posadasii (strain RMSCC 757 / Silveira) TaxID=443226 RepID=E9CTL9_COCPS|nr:conserved hypothetical protein [Coccidioides posadasii str. Silveira]QVM06403.1 hypothetical protein D8B26_001116 [Coccidioides posadasii str. Silveira]